MKQKKHLVNFSGVFNTILIALALAVFFIPEVKAFAVQKLMQIGLFQPEIPQKKAGVQAPGTPKVLFKNPTGAITDLSALKGRVVFINFWATWCPPCIAEMPGIDSLYRRIRQHPDLIFMMVDVDCDPGKSLAFLKKRKLELPLFLPASAIPTRYLGGSIPTTLVFDKQGQLVFKHEGIGDFSGPEFQKFMEQLLET